MSYNIDTAAFIGPSTLSIGGGDVRDLKERLGDRLPSSNLIDAILRKTAGKHLGTSVPGLRLVDTEDYPITATELWAGELSGRTYDDLINEVLPVTSGDADIVFTWEGGDSHTGVRVRGGVVTRHKVVLALGESE